VGRGEISYKFKMKKIFFLLFILGLCVFVSNCSLVKIQNKGSDLTHNNSTHDKNYFISEISTIGNVYVITLSHNDTIFRVLSTYGRNLMKIKLNNHYSGEMIKVGNTYNLSLEIYYECNSIETVSIINYNHTNIVLNKNETIYTCKDLDGLYLCF